MSFLLEQMRMNRFLYFFIQKSLRYLCSGSVLYFERDGGWQCDITEYEYDISRNKCDNERKNPAIDGYCQGLNS